MLKGTFYKMISSTKNDDSSFTSTLLINKEHEIFNGHFPDLPIVPGVCMMQIIKEQLEENLHTNLSLQSAANIKFLSLINPLENNKVEVSVKHQKTDDGAYMTDAVISVEGQPYFKLVRAIYK